MTSFDNIKVGDRVKSLETISNFRQKGKEYQVIHISYNDKYEALVLWYHDDNRNRTFSINPLSWSKITRQLPDWF